MLTWAIILAVLAVVPPLTDDQHARLDTAAADTAQLEDPALYPLLENVLQWDADAGEAGARVPDYDALLADPAAERGELFLIEGRFAGRARRYPLEHTGLWGDALTEWVLLVRDDPDEVAVVYFVDPQGAIGPPVTGSSVRVVGRFFKVWADTDQAGAPARYLTFVARGPSTVASPAPAQPIPAFLMLLIVAGLGVIYLLVRRMGKPQPHRTHPRRVTRPRSDDAILSDPAEALQRLAEQRDRH